MQAVKFTIYAVLLSMIAPKQGLSADEPCRAQLQPQTTVGERYELGARVQPRMGTFPIVHPNARYVRALLSFDGATECEWYVIVRDKQGRALQVYPRKSFQSNHRWTGRVPGDTLNIDVVPCRTKEFPNIVVSSYIEMPLQSANPYYSIQDPIHRQNVELFSSSAVEVTNATPLWVRRLGDNVGFAMMSYNRKSWICSGVMLARGLFLTNWHCGGIDPLAESAYWRDDIVHDLLLDLSWDGDQISREYEGEELIAGSAVLDYALVKVRSSMGSDEVVPVKLATGDPQKGAPVVIIHHMEGLPKQASRCVVDFVSWPNPNTPSAEFAHQCDTEKGSSGAPVFDSDGKLMGIHHEGFLQDKSCMPLDKENKAIKIKAIVEDIRLKYPAAFDNLKSAGVVDQ